MQKTSQVIYIFHDKPGYNIKNLGGTSLWAGDCLESDRHPPNWAWQKPTVAQFKILPKTTHVYQKLTQLKNLQAPHPMAYVVTG